MSNLLNEKFEMRLHEYYSENKIVKGNPQRTKIAKFSAKTEDGIEFTFRMRGPEAAVNARFGPEWALSLEPISEIQMEMKPLADVIVSENLPTTQVEPIPTEDEDDTEEALFELKEDTFSI